MRTHLSAMCMSVLRCGMAAVFCALATPAPAQTEPFSAIELDILLAPRRIALEDKAQRARQDLLLDRLAKTDPDAADWPVTAFLRAEARLARGETERARQLYLELVEAAATRLNTDTLGGHALVPFAIWRWLALAAEVPAPEPETVRAFASQVDALMGSRLGRAAFTPHPTLPSLPLLEEKIFHLLAEIAHRAGLKAEAAQYYLHYLSRLRSDRSPPASDPLYRFVLEQDVASADRIALIRGRRLYALGGRDNRDAAMPYLEEAARSADSQVAVEAMFWLARAIRKTTPENNEKALDWYDRVERFAARDRLVEEAAFRRAIRLMNMGRDYKPALEAVIARFPQGAFTDNALFFRALGELIDGRLDEALPWFDRLRAYKGDNDRRDSASLLPALSFIWRGTPGDNDRARQLLEDYLAESPQGALSNRARFWLGRLAEDRGEEAEAQRQFRILVEENPFDYYGLRARMHLHGGKSARSQLLAWDGAVREELQQAYRRDPPQRFDPDAFLAAQQAAAEDAAAAAGTGKSARKSLFGPYRKRMEGALASGLYAAAMQSEERLQQFDATRRIEDFHPEEIDQLGLLTRVAVMLALRQETVTAIELEDTTEIRLAMADAVARWAADWPLSMTLIYSGWTTAFPEKTALMNTPGYLRIAYPAVYGAALRKHAREHDVDPALLYAVMRNESRFHPAALSSAEALGLFQFIPRTFDRLDKDKLEDGTPGLGWRLLEEREAPNRVAFLQNRDNSIYLGARWFGELLLPSQDGNVLHAVMEHHSGNSRVEAWKRTWAERGWLDDVELMVESFRTVDLPPGDVFGWGIEARVFVRGFVADFIIADALGIYDR